MDINMNTMVEDMLGSIFDDIVCKVYEKCNNDEKLVIEEMVEMVDNNFTMVLDEVKKYCEWLDDKKVIDYWNEYFS